MDILNEPAEPLRICIDCKWCADRNSIPLCRAPQAPVSMVDGKHFLSCHTHRDPNFAASHPERYCGPSAQWFEPKAKPKEYME